MSTIKQLPESTRSSVRSGVILCDLTRVVEELVLNSVDAGARKVSVFVGIGSSFVKVVDDGSGITRDGLVLLGERYATSKHYDFDDVDAGGWSPGSRGEALASISDVSLLEIISKTHGRPNGYRKLLKGCKSLYLGIDDSRNEIGTTVVVRDLFYNQPIRRKYMQSSCKKVLDAVKKCVSRIAIVQPQISFKVVDNESEDELLSTRPSSSPLPLLRSGFGIDVSTAFHELNAHQGSLLLTGYLSNPSNCLPVKAVQYVYINSRFISKSPIHKLVNSIANKFEGITIYAAGNGSRKGKRNRPWACPFFILKLNCPQSSYDLSFEPSKTLVEFKDWACILAFIENAVEEFWSEKASEGLFPHDMLGEDLIQRECETRSSAKEGEQSEIYEVRKKSWGSKTDWDCSDFSSFSVDGLTEKSHQSVDADDEGSNLLPYYLNNRNFGTQQDEMGSLRGNNLSKQWSSNESHIKHIDQVNPAGENEQGAFGDDFPSEGGDLLERSSIAEKDNENIVDCCVAWEEKSLRFHSAFMNDFDMSTSALDFPKLSNDFKISDGKRKWFLHGCSSRGKLPVDTVLLDGGINEYETFALENEQQSGFDHIGHRTLNTRDRIFSEQDFVLGVPQKDKSCCVWPFLHLGSDDYIPTKIDCPSVAFPMSSQIHNYYAEENGIKSLDFIQKRNASSHIQSSVSELDPLAIDALFGSTVGEEEHCINTNLVNSIRDSRKCSYNRRFNEEKGWNFSCNIMETTPCKGKNMSSDIDSRLKYKSAGSYSTNFCESLKVDNQSTCWPESFNISTDKRNRLSQYLSHKDFTQSSGYGNNMEFGQNGSKQNHICKERPRRSHSAPPFYKRKMQFISLNNLSVSGVHNPDGRTPKDLCDFRDAGERHHELIDRGEHLYSKHCTEKLPLWESRQEEQEPCVDPNISIDKDVSMDIQNSGVYGTKWREIYVKENNAPCQRKNEIDILDISSGFLHLTGDSLVPKSIGKTCFENAKVLPQVDKKFIPVVAGRTLALIDQHAADERIRLEELRQKVLNGEERTVKYLDSEKELVLSEIGYQLLHSYSEQIKDWGWICNIHAESSRTFKKNLNLLHRQRNALVLLAVPNILGVDLTDADLLEFLQQLADTDGSSAIPPAVVRILNSKACRGAIMFGDSLLPSECSLIVEELKQTSLCFQCAHGRPTTAPLVNLEALNRQIDKLSTLDNSSTHSWHGLKRHEVSVDRASRRLQLD